MTVLDHTQPAAPATTPRTELTKTQRSLIGTVAAGATVIAGIGFAGSYRAVTKLAIEKDFGHFAYAFPIGIDAGIGVLLALDLLLTWLRIPFAALRYCAWGLTAATIAFNAAAAWGDDIAVAMHASIPALFVIVVEAARHAVGRLANLHANAFYESPPRWRWILAPYPTYRIWRRQRMWNIRSYEQVVEMERQTKILKATLKARHGRGWKNKAEHRETLALRLARFGTPVADTLAARYETGVAARPATRRATASASPLAAPAPTAATATPADTPASASPAEGATATPNSGHAPLAADASANTVTPAANPEPANASVETAAANNRAASPEQRDLDEVAAAFRDLRNELGRSPSDQALATRLGVGRSRAQQLRTAAIKAGHHDLEKPLRAAS